MSEDKNTCPHCDVGNTVILCEECGTVICRECGHKWEAEEA